MSKQNIDEQPLLDTCDQIPKIDCIARHNAISNARSRCQGHHLCLLIVIITMLLFYALENRFELRSLKLTSKTPTQDLQFSYRSYVPLQNATTKQAYLIYTETCQLRDWPLFDEEIKLLYKNWTDKELQCNKHLPPFRISRVNFTWLKIDFPHGNVNWTCYATELARDEKVDGLRRGPVVGPLSALTNLANNLSQTERLASGPVRWDSVEVTCHNPDYPTAKFSRVVPLVQHYTSTYKSNARMSNLILLGIDSISRLNFDRHLVRTKQFLDKKGFIPMFGYHKTGENSFPNIFSMFTGRLYPNYYNDSWGDKFRFDWVPLIPKNFEEQGYVTTFIEDMSPFGFFSGRGGFSVQPTDYYLRPSNMAIWPSLYNGYACYQERIEHELYWHYLLDLFAAFRHRGNQSHFTFAHMSTLTHNLFNYAGLVDKPFHHFLHRLFAEDHHLNSVIMLYSDHALRFGPVMRTKASIYESKLPFFYIYLPDSLTLSGLNATQLRAISRDNQYRLSSHIDLHATMLHILHGEVPRWEQFSRSLLSPIALDRTCASAGIPSQYCLCNPYQPVNVTSEVVEQGNLAVTYINRLVSSHGNHCVPLKLNSVQYAFDSSSVTPGEMRRLVQFQTIPNQALFEATLRIDSGRQLAQVEHVSRLTAYATQAKCVRNNLLIVQYCYCWQAFKQDRKRMNHKTDSFNSS